MDKVFIIAEAGVNHNSSIEIAKKLIDVAKEAGCDAVKFQTFNSKKMVSMRAPKAAYQEKNTVKGETQYCMLKKLELSHADHRKLMKYCIDKGIVFMSSPFDEESIEFLNKLNVSIFKIPSGEITNKLYLKKIGSYKKKVIMSTGMAYLNEIGDAIDVLISSGMNKKDITLLHCNTEYPTPMKNVNLRSMLTIKNKFDTKVGYSDHTMGIEIAIAAVALGASVIEKHLTLDKKMDGPDHKASLEPDELKAMVKAIRNVEKAMGDGIKKPSKVEKENIAVVRKSIVAARNIRKGEIFNEDNIIVKRPGTGISPFKWDYIIGKIAKKDFKEDDLIEI